MFSHGLGLEQISEYRILIVKRAGNLLSIYLMSTNDSASHRDTQSIDFHLLRGIV